MSTQYKLLTTLSTPGFDKGAVVTESKDARGTAGLALVTLDGVDYIVVPRSQLERLTPVEPEGECPYNGAFVTVGKLCWRSAVSTGTNCADLRVGGDTTGVPVWEVVGGVKGRDLKDVLVNWLGTTVLATAVLQTIRGAYVDLRAIGDGMDMLREAGVTLRPGGATVDTELGPLSCTLTQSPDVFDTADMPLTAAREVEAERAPPVVDTIVDEGAASPEVRGHQDIPNGNAVLHYGISLAGHPVLLAGPAIFVTRGEYSGDAILNAPGAVSGFLPRGLTREQALDILKLLNS